MKKSIALISDNHSYVGDDILEHLKDKDEIWHAGDIGALESIAPIIEMTPVFRAVYGNIDDADTRHEYPLDLFFESAGLKVLMTHIGGYPGRYKKRTIQLLDQYKPDLYICGHSHILKVMRDKKRDIIHMNPGAYGHHGFHKIRTLLQFELENGVIGNLKVIELGIRGVTNKNWKG